MKPPELQDTLTNELTANKLSLAFNRIYGLPAAKYKIVRYEALFDDCFVHVQVHFQHEKTHVTVKIQGPNVNGVLNWGLKVGEKYITELHREDGEKHYCIEGYLRPE